MINYITKYFTLNRRERNGVIAMSAVLFFLLLVKYYVAYCYSPVVTPVVVTDLTETAKQLAELKMKKRYEEKQLSALAGRKNSASFFNFDPNTVTVEQAVQLGFKEKTAQTLLKYRSKGGKFRKPEDLKKLYGVSDQLYERLLPFIVIGSKKEQNENNFTEQKPPQESISIEINSADSLQWLKLKALRPWQVKRILKYRGMLGGFYKTEQLLEVYDFKDSLYQLIKTNLTVNPSLVQRIKVNEVDFKTMVHHPYIKYEGTKCIFALKRGKKMTAEDLRNSSCFSRDQLDKVLPYLDFD